MISASIPFSTIALYHHANIPLRLSGITMVEQPGREGYRYIYSHDCIYEHLSDTYPD
jgi:hypothetical protein